MREERKYLDYNYLIGESTLEVCYTTLGMNVKGTETYGEAALTSDINDKLPSPKILPTQNE